MKEFFEKSKEAEVLEKELAIEEKKLEVDEKRTRNAFLITALVVLIIFVNIVIIYSFILKPRVIISEKSPRVPTPTPTVFIEPSPTITSTPISNSTQTNIKEYFIPFGSGTSSSGDWTDAEGLLASIDFSNYSNIKEIRFEASTSIPTGNQTVWIRIYNKTDNHPVWNSDVSFNGTGGYSVSLPIVHDSGLKTYQVQAKTQLKFPVNITQSRLHIILN